jgi:integrase
MLKAISLRAREFARDTVMKWTLKYVCERKNAYGRVYYYFFKRGMPTMLRLPSVPGAQEFTARYEELLRAHAPQVMHAKRGGYEKGTLGWVVEQFLQPDALPWSTLADGTRAKYRLRFDWLREHHGNVLLAAFDREAIKSIRNKLKNVPTAANEIIDRLGQLWRWADENCNLEGEAKLIGSDPTQGVKHIATEPQSALAWPEELCQKFEGIKHTRMITFYFLARYSGQRRGDCCEMKWTDFNSATNEIYVVQEKTNKKIWVPCHDRLRAYLDALAREGEYILMSPRGGRYNDSTVSQEVGRNARLLGFPGHTPHGLRHAACVALLEAGCSTDQAMAITGHTSRAQFDVYARQVSQRRLAHEAMAKWNAADRRRDATDWAKNA